MNRSSNHGAVNIVTYTGMPLSPDFANYSTNDVARKGPYSALLSYHTSKGHEPNPQHDLKDWADSTISSSLINHISIYPLRQKPPLQKSTQPFATTTKIHLAFFHHY